MLRPTAIASHNFCRLPSNTKRDMLNSCVKTSVATSNGWSKVVCAVPIFFVNCPSTFGPTTTSSSWVSLKNNEVCYGLYPPSAAEHSFFQNAVARTVKSGVNVCVFYSSIAREQLETDKLNPREIKHYRSKRTARPTVADISIPGQTQDPKTAPCICKPPAHHRHICVRDGAVRNIQHLMACSPKIKTRVERRRLFDNMT